jgi:hypothetical protein
MKVFTILAVTGLLYGNAFAQKPDDHADYVNSHSVEILEQRSKSLAAQGYELHILQMDETRNGNGTIYHIVDAEITHYGSKLCDIKPTSIKTGEVIGDESGETLWCDTGDQKIAISLYCEAGSHKIYTYLFYPNEKHDFAQAKTKILDQNYLARKKEEKAAAVAAAKTDFFDKDIKNNPVSLNY